MTKNNSKKKSSLVILEEIIGGGSMFDDEIWKDIYFIRNGELFDYRGSYQISNYGRVKSLNYNKTGKEKILKPFDNRRGYFCVSLCKNGKTRTGKIHVLVAHMFIDGYFEGAVVDHIDTNPSNNHYTNLRWCSRKENSNNPLTLKHSSEGNKGELIARYSLDGVLLDIKYQFEYVQLEFNGGAISECCKWYACGEDREQWFKTHKGNPRKSHKGCIFKYREE